MPWCTTCDRFLSPSTVHANGTCPSCGATVDAGRARAATAVEHPPAQGSDDSDVAAGPVPWHLKLLLVALAIYLAYRLFQGVAWLVAHL